MPSDRGLYIALFSVHGLVRGERMELGRDADTGGQVKYVVELARALGKDPRVERVDLFTRRIEDPKVDSSYAVESERIGANAWITRLRCGPRRYLRKEVLWPHLDSLGDQALKHFSRLGRIPDVVHGHYADAGFVGSSLAATLGVPFIFTGHSLGRVKRQRLIEHGLSPESIEKQYNISRRIEAEETALDYASFVVASTRQEVEEQYALYDRYEPRRMVVIPPGVDIERFRPPRRSDETSQFEDDIRRFLTDPTKPIILALSRPDPRKNLQTLVRAFGEDPRLRENANLVIVAGNRDDIEEIERGPRDVLSELLYLIDLYDL
ncbi:MAG TPA: glycosyltransferase, partial [Planctomycetota bacterium]|nr:glycosyltransferase [Planctomycetota bacterium]